jgi:hypothetical protein
MSEIDCYKHECIGVLHCPSTYAIVPGNDSHRNIPLYRLDEAVPEWEAKPGDLMLGGGGGESAVLRMSMPEIFLLLTHDDWMEPVEYDQILRAYWSMTNAYVFCEGYAKLGWTPNSSIETWLAEHVLAFLLREYPDVYGKFRGDLSLERDGSICRTPTLDERHVL